MNCSISDICLLVFNLKTFVYYHMPVKNYLLVSLFVFPGLEVAHLTIYISNILSLSRVSSFVLVFFFLTWLVFG